MGIKRSATKRDGSRVYVNSSAAMWSAKIIGGTRVDETVQRYMAPTPVVVSRTITFANFAPVRVK